MTFVPPDNTDFLNRYPEFSAASVAAVEGALSEALGVVDETWIERDRIPAILTLAAHNLALEGEPTRTLRGSSFTPQQGVVSSESVDGISRSYDTSTLTTRLSRSAGDSFYNQTRYGQKFLLLQKRNFPAVTTT